MQSLIVLGEFAIDKFTRPDIAASKSATWQVHANHGSVLVCDSACHEQGSTAPSADLKRILHLQRRNYLKQVDQFLRHLLRTNWVVEAKICQCARARVDIQRADATRATKQGDGLARSPYCFRQSVPYALKHLSSVNTYQRYRSRFCSRDPCPSHAD